MQDIYELFLKKLEDKILLTKRLMEKLDERTIIEQQIHLSLWLKPKNMSIINMDKNVKL